MGFRHQRVQRLRRLVRQRSYREAERAFVAEGSKVIGEALSAGADVEAVFVDDEAVAGEGTLLQRAAEAGARVHRLAPGVIGRVAGTVTPQPVIATVAMGDLPLGALRQADFVVVLVEVRDPGNAGTVLRTAEAAGAGGIVCCDGSVDVFNPKTVRASAGSLFHVPVVSGGDPLEVLEELGRWELTRLATSAHAGSPYDAVDLTGGVALVLGNEAHGLPPGLDDQLDGVVTIPMAGRAESLNVGMAAAVIAFEARRQRRAGGG